MIPARLYLSDTKASSAPLQRAVPPELRPAERRPTQECRRLTDPRRPGIAKDARTAPRYARTADRQRPPSTAPSPSVQKPPAQEKIGNPEKRKNPPPRAEVTAERPGPRQNAPGTRRVSPRPPFLPSDRLPADALQILVRAAEMAAAEKSPIGRQGRRVDRLENAVAAADRQPKPCAAHTSPTACKRPPACEER